MFDSLLAKGADDPSTRYYIACMYALSGDRERALDSLERVAAKLPALTAARVRRDPDVDALRSDPRFEAIAALQAR
jgi:adenylate cyclase